MASYFDILHVRMEPQYPFAYWEIFHAPVVVFSHFSKTFNKNLNSNTDKWFESRSGWTLCLSFSGSKLFVNFINYQQTTKVAARQKLLLETKVAARQKLLLDKSSCYTKVAARQKLLQDKSSC